MHDVKAGPQGDIGEVAAVGDGWPAEKDLEVDILPPLLGPGRLDVVPEKPEANLAEDRSRPGIVLRLGRQAAGDNERGQKNERKHPPRTRNLQRNRHEGRHTPLHRSPPSRQRPGALRSTGSSLAQRTAC